MMEMVKINPETDFTPSPEPSFPNCAGRPGTPLKCEECGVNPADFPSRICVGCQAYREHTGVF